MAVEQDFGLEAEQISDDMVRELREAALGRRTGAPTLAHLFLLLESNDSVSNNICDHATCVPRLLCHDLRGQLKRSKSPNCHTFGALSHKIQPDPCSHKHKNYTQTFVTKVLTKKHTPETHRSWVIFGREHDLHG